MSFYLCNFMEIKHIKRHETVFDRPFRQPMECNIRHFAGLSQTETQFKRNF